MAHRVAAGIRFFLAIYSLTGRQAQLAFRYFMRIVHNNWHETQPIWYLLKIVTRKRSESFNLEAITSDKVTRLENISDSYWQRRGLLATKEGREHRPLLFRSRKYLKATYRYNLIRMQNDTYLCLLTHYLSVWPTLWLIWRAIMPCMQLTKSPPYSYQMLPATLRIFLINVVCLLSFG